MDKIYKEIEAAALTIMIEQAKSILQSTESLDEASIRITLIPTTLVKSICKTHNSKIYKHVCPSFPEIKKGQAFIKGVLTPNESEIKYAVSILSTIANPAGKFAREILSNTEDKPEFKKLTSILRSFGLDIVLGVFDELLKSGIRPEHIMDSLRNYYIDTLKLDLTNDERTSIINILDIASTKNIESGIVSGACDTSSAKTGETLGGIGGAVAGAKIGGIIGSIVPGPGTVIGAAIGAALGRKYGATKGNTVGQTLSTENSGAPPDSNKQK
jgi:hypothetical protein